MKGRSLRDELPKGQIIHLHFSILSIHPFARHLMAPTIVYNEESAIGSP